MHRVETLGGMGGGTLEVAMWNRAARLFVNSGQGGLPVATVVVYMKENKKK